eukprot:m.173472 g.173472  ORF g.173472 m.173472 type:complete len:87 (-) comp14849_c0_seq2:2667-2927(-)
MDLKAILKGLKPELVAAKEKWAEQIKTRTGKTKEQPFPISICRTIPQPEASSDWDMNELKISLSIDGVADDGKAIVHAEVRSTMPR